MSGIYIKGMEMPTSCGKCGWYNFIEEVCRANRCEIPATDNVYLSRHKDCPIIPVPPHGRLGDLDKLVAAYDAEHVGPPGRARGLMMEAPTVIPAEEGK